MNDVNFILEQNMSSKQIKNVTRLKIKERRHPVKFLLRKYNFKI